MKHTRRILICATGLSPQIVTETIYALAVATKPRWIPDEVRLFTTLRGAESARLNLLSAAPGWFQRLRMEYGLPPIRFDEHCIEIICDGEGQPLDDLRCQSDNDAAADHITTRVRALASDPDNELHVSIAGGRKTMGYYLGYALSLYGRAQDRLSHVLVSPPFESHPQFFYPSRNERVIQTLGTNPQPLDCQRAEVQLAEIPFVRLRDDLPERFRTSGSFSATVHAANRALLEPRIVLDINRRHVLVDDEGITLGKTPFAVLLWLAKRAQLGKPAIDWARPAAADEFLAMAAQVMNPMSGSIERIESALEWRKSAAIKLAQYFEPHKARINKLFVQTLGERAAARYINRLILVRT